MRDIYPIYPSSMNGLGHLATSSDSDPRTASAYRTTYKSYYHGSSGAPAPNGRQIFETLPDPSQPRGLNSSIYKHDFITNPVNRELKLRCGTSSGLRKNNPHPHNMIHASQRPDHNVVVWNHYAKLPPLHQDELGTSSEDLLKKLSLARTKSTYQSDFIRPAKEFFSGMSPSFTGRTEMSPSDGNS